jgi:hypothetical protein
MQLSRRARHRVCTQVFFALLLMTALFRAVPAGAATGDTLWVQSTQGSGTSDSVTGGGNFLHGRRSLALTAAGDAVTAGSVSMATGGYDWRVTRYANTNGAVVWQQTYHGGFGDDHAISVALDASGNAVVAGTVSTATGKAFHVRKLAAADGGLIWQATVALPEATQALHVRVDANGHAVVAGTVATTTNDWLIVKLDGAGGAVLWQQTLSGPADDEPYALAIDPASGDAVVAGRLTNATFGTFTTARFAAADGAVLWQRSMTVESAALDVAIDGTGSIVTAGMQFGSPYRARVTKHSATGTELWSYTNAHTKATEAFALALGNAGEVTISGYRDHQNAGAGTDVWVARLNAATGAEMWEYYNGTANPGWAVGLAVDSNGDVFLAGREHLGVSANPYWALRKTQGFTSTGAYNSNQLFARLYTTGANFAEPSALAVGQETAYVHGLWREAFGGKFALRLMKLANPPEDNIPNNVSFPNQTGPVSQWLVAEPRTVSSINVPITISVGANAEYSIGCTGTFTAAEGMISNGQTFCMRAMTAATYGSTRQINVFLAGRQFSYFVSSQRLPTVTLASATPNPAYYDVPVTYTVTVTGAGGTPQGLVDIRLNGESHHFANFNCSQVPLVNGSATCQAMHHSNSPNYFLGTFSVSAYYYSNTPSTNEYAPAESASISHVTRRYSQVVTFPPIANVQVGAFPFEFTPATVSSGLMITYTSATPMTCGTTGQFGQFAWPKSPGTCTIVAHAPQTFHYDAAQAQQSFEVVPNVRAPQTITFAPLSDRPQGSPAFTVSATGGGAPVPVVFSSLTPAQCTSARLNGATITVRSPGTCTIAANQGGGSLHLPAPQVTQSFQVLASGHSLSVSRTGGGSGSVAGGGIQCGGSGDACSSYFESGTTVVLTAFAAPGSVVAGWTGCDSTIGAECRVLMNTTRVVTATFNLHGEPSALDFNADGRPDLLYRTTDGTLHLLTMAGIGSIAADLTIPGANASWTLEGSADFDGNGHPDILWRKPDGSVVLWYLVNGVFQSEVSLLNLPVSIVIQGVADFNGDSSPDLLLRDTESGLASVRYFDNPTPIPQGEQLFFTFAPSWKVEVVGDFDRDGQPDMLFRDMLTGLAFIWHSQFAGGAIQLGSTTHPIFVIDPVWEVVQAADWNLDGQLDLVLRNRNTGQAMVLFLVGEMLAGSAPLLAIDPAWELVPHR